MCTVHSALLNYPFRPGGQSAADYLFAESASSRAERVDTREAELIYNNYVEPLISSYDKLKTRYCTYAGKCLTDRMKKDYNISAVPPALTLPHLNQDQWTVEESKLGGGQSPRQIVQMADIGPMRSVSSDERIGEEDLSLGSHEDEHDLNESVQEQREVRMNILN